MNEKTLEQEEKELLNLVKDVIQKCVFNYTPHEVNVYVQTDEGLEKGITLSSIGVARVNTIEEKVSHEGIFVRTRYGEVTGLPDQENDCLLIVSNIVRLAAPERKDLITPHDFVRNAVGDIIGCKKFIVNF